MPATGRPATVNGVTNARSPHETPVGQDPTWWARGLSLADRLPVNRRPVGGDAAERAGRRLARWLSPPPVSAPAAGGGVPPEPLTARLVEHGLDEADLLALPAEAPVELALRPSRPARADLVE